MSGVFSITIPGKPSLARFPVRAFASVLIIASLVMFHAASATAQHRFNVPQSAHGIQNAKQAAQIRLLETWAGLVKKAITVTEDGRVGIGTSTPVKSLDVRGEGVFQGRLSLTPYNKAPIAGIRTWHIDNVLPTGSSSDYKFRIFYQPDLETAGITVFTVQANGHVGIGIDAPTQMLHVSGNGLFTGSLTATAFYQSSDRNLKENITAVSNPFALLHGIYGKRYTWKDSKKPAYGVIAQDVEKVMPEAVQTADDGRKSVEYSQLIAPLIEAVKQLESRVRTLEAENSKLRANSDTIHEMNGVMWTTGAR